MKHLGKTVFLFVLTLNLVSCGSVKYTFSSGGTGYQTWVNSFGDYKLDGQTYYIAPGAAEVNATDPEFKEYADLLEKTLCLSGAQITTDKSSADMCILMNYGIFDKSYNEDDPVPIWGRTGISSITTNSTTTASAYGSASANANASAFGSTVYGSASSYGSASGYSNTTTTTHVTPTYGITGIATINRHVNLYNRVINIYAYDNKSASHDMLWKTNLVSDGNSSDFRTVAPYMFYSAWGDLGKNTNEEYGVREGDYMFQCWKKGILSDSNITPYPRLSSTNCSDFCDVSLVERLPNETVVILQFSQNSIYVIPPYTFIEANGTKYQITSIDGYRMGARAQSLGTAYMRLHFPAIPSSTSTFDIVMYNNKKLTRIGAYWRGLILR
ncbi:MAG: hypothetical protein K6F98_07760 [Bacteroidales bacterium]|nr:hypothetical protein [Bacteroidales bacterium]